MKCLEWKGRCSRREEVFLRNFCVWKRRKRNEEKKFISAF